MISEESLVRPSYTGTGIIHLEASMGGYYTFDLAGESWILENGAYWASDGGVELCLFRERVWTSLWAGEGFVDYQTRVSGHGWVVLNAPDPVEEIVLHGDRLVVEGKKVIARTEGLGYRIRRATSLVQSFISGESAVRIYQGTGKALVCWTPYWNQHLLNRMRVSCVRPVARLRQVRFRDWPGQGQGADSAPTHFCIMFLISASCS
jgi:uncharacterized protein (AIM24 family)